MEPSFIHSTFVLERSYTASPERLYAALTDPARKRRWFAEGEKHDIEEFVMDFRVGGEEHARYRFKEGTPFPGASLTNDATYLEIVPLRRIVQASTMAMDGRRFSASLATFEILPTDKGSDLIFTHQGAFFEGSDGPKMREDGWRKLFERLTAEVAASAPCPAER